MKSLRHFVRRVEGRPSWRSILSRHAQCVLRPGDHIATDLLVPYTQHHGIYVGVVRCKSKQHIGQFAPAVVQYCSDGKVRIVTLERFIGNAPKFYLVLSPRTAPRKKVVARAMSWLGRGRSRWKSRHYHQGDYHLTRQNCESFVNAVRSGKPHSAQVVRVSRLFSGRLVHAVGDVINPAVRRAFNGNA